jgi:hypothetical protein
VPALVADHGRFGSRRGIRFVLLLRIKVGLPMRQFYVDHDQLAILREAEKSEPQLLRQIAGEHRTAR